MSLTGAFSALYPGLGSVAAAATSAQAGDGAFRVMLAKDLVATIRAQRLVDDVLRELTAPETDRMTSVGECAAAALARIARPRLARATAGGVDILNPGLPGIQLELGMEACASEGAILEWVVHLSRKNWVSKQTLIDFIDAARTRLPAT